jgi:hypothetical protein
VETIIKRDARVSTVPPPISLDDPYGLRVRDLRCAIHYRGELVHGASRDLSMSGLSVRCLEPLDVGEHIDVELTLVFEGGHASEPLSLSAEVVWCSALRSEFQIGAKFVDMNRDQHEFVRVFVEFLDGAPAATA